MKTAIVSLVLIAAAAASSASTLDLLRNRLGSLPGTASVSGKVEVVAEEAHENKTDIRRAEAEFDCDASALRLSVAARDLGEKNGHANIEKIRLTRLWATLNSSTSMTSVLRRASLISDQPSTWSGQPARRLEFKVQPEMGDVPPKMLRVKMEETLAVWVAADGTPLGSEQTMKGSARLLFISASGSGTTRTDYVVVGDRLVGVRTVDESSSSGMGESGHEKTVTTLMLRR